MWRRFHFESYSSAPEANSGDNKWPNHKDHHPRWANDKIVLRALGDGKTEMSRRSLCLERAYDDGLSTTNARSEPYAVPWTGMAAPVITRDAGVARKSMTEAISSGFGQWT